MRCNVLTLALHCEVNNHLFSAMPQWYLKGFFLFIGKIAMFASVGGTLIVNRGRRILPAVILGATITAKFTLRIQLWQVKICTMIVL